MPPVEPSAFGFRSIRPRSRQERLTKKDKVSLEKERIMSAKMHRENAPETSAGLVTCVDGGAGYLSNADRFHSDTCGEEMAHRQEQIRKKQAAIEFRKNQGAVREEGRWKAIEEARAQAEAAERRVREEGLKGAKNLSRVAYDIVSLQYESSDEGQLQKYQDDLVRYRAEVRKQQLVKNGDSRASYNIISGEAAPAMPPPPRVPRPAASEPNSARGHHR